MKNLFIILFALIWTVTHIDDSKAQVTVWKTDMVKTKISGGDSLSYTVDNAYLPNANLSTYEFVLRDPISGFRSTVTRATLNASPTFTGTVTVPTPATSGSATTKAYVDAAISAIPTPISRVFNNNVSRSLNSNYTISTTRDAQVTYSISISVTNPLLAGSSTGSAFLEYSTNAGANWTTVSQVVNASSVGVAVAIALTQPNTFVLSGLVPANALVRVRSTTAGTASVTYTSGQEVLL